jgi:beta-galactosidase
MVTEAARPGKGTAYVRDRAVWVGDRRVSLVSGEVHYWRLDPGVWPRVLSAAQELGLRTVASYVQWHFHEVRPGEFDFVGATDRRRNLVAYLDLVREAGLDLIIRPGPYT